MATAGAEPRRLPVSLPALRSGAMRVLPRSQVRRAPAAGYWSPTLARSFADAAELPAADLVAAATALEWPARHFPAEGIGRVCRIPIGPSVAVKTESERSS